MLFKLYFIPTFKFNQEENCIFEANFLVYAKEKKNITKVEMMMEIYNTYDELLIYLIYISIILEISFFSYTGRNSPFRQNFKLPNVGRNLV